MPALVRKILICAGAQGLLLQPVNHKNQPSTSPAIVIDYKSNAISPSLHHNKDDESGEQLETHGIVGLLDLAATSYLISISRREQVAQIRGKPVYVISDVTLIPLSSRKDAENAIAQAKKSLQQNKTGTVAEEDTDDEDDAHEAGSTLTDDEHEDVQSISGDVPGGPEAQKGIGPLKKGTSVVADVIKNKGNYGRFAEKWFSNAGWKASASRSQSLNVDNDDLTREQKRQGLESLPDDSKPTEQPLDTAKEPKEDNKQETAKEAAQDLKAQSKTPVESVMQRLTPRILRSIKLFLASKSFYFSYDYDISHSIHKQEPTSSTLPLFKRFDPLFFWNKSMIDTFIESGQQGYVLPVIQGFVGQRAFSIGKNVHDKDKIVDATEKAGEVIEMQERKQANPDAAGKPATADDKESERNNADAQDFLLTLISRRSVKRAGLRYLRRGVDDQGNVANCVETEQILSSQSWEPSSKSFSLVQLRGSMPLFFSQSPYSFKPVPVTYGSEVTNHAAFNKHFASIFDRYGDVQVASLVDKHATEASIGELYQQHAELTNSGKMADSGIIPAGRKLGFEWFDFHHECRGMKFENVSILMEKLGSTLAQYSWTEMQDSKPINTQSGVLRTNCMDCLDRTNVVQSAVAGQTLQAQLQTLGLSIDLHSDPKTSWFNTLWADNGDAISRQYAGTAALKGDFTRTRKRAWTGALSDFSLTLNRYYNNIFSDYFLQTCIDYMLGNADAGVFTDFETDLMTQDYALDIKRVRQSAIETCVKIVLGSKRDRDDDGDEEEDLVSGWTLGTPAEPNTLRSLPFEECVVLLTDQALYAVRFDWNTEKVGSFERVALADIQGLQRGTYVTSTLGPTHMDEAKNVGFVVQYRSENEGVVGRSNTRSLGNEVVTPGDEIGEYKLNLNKSETHKDESISESANTTTHDATDEKKTEPNAKEAKSDPRILAFKALPPRATAAKETSSSTDAQRSQLRPRSGSSDMDEAELTRHICGEIRRLAVRAGAKRSLGKKKDQVDEVESGKTQSEEVMWDVEEKDVIGVDEARAKTGYLETLGYSLKKLVWA